MKDNLISKTFLWMCFGLLITFLTGYFVSHSEVMLENIYGGMGYWIFVIVELVLVIVLSVRVMKMKPATAKVCFLLYSFVSGLTFASIFVYYAIDSIMLIFLVAAVIFAVMALIGYTTNVDLTKLGTYLFFGLIAVLVVALINIFLNNSMVAMIVSIICVLVFIGITAYDVQKIKMLENSALQKENLAIYGALDLYLDFINLFIHLLSLFGRSRD